MHNAFGELLVLFLVQVTVQTAKPRLAPLSCIRSNNMVDLNVAYLGPNGSFSHLASINYCNRNPSLGFQYHPHADFSSVFKSVINDTRTIGVVPACNSIIGAVKEVEVLLQEFKDSVEIKDTVEQKIELALYVNHLAGTSRRLKCIKSKAEAIQQCANYLKANFPDVALVPTLSTADGANSAAAEEEIAMGAIISTEGFQFLDSNVRGNLSLLEESIQDVVANQTTFYVLKQKGAWV